MVETVNFAKNMYEQLDTAVLVNNNLQTDSSW